MPELATLPHRRAAGTMPAVHA